MPGAAAAADPDEELLSDLQPGESVLVWYDGDPMWHERLAIAAITRDVWFIATPDRDAYAERLIGNRSSGCGPSHCLRMPGGIVPATVAEAVYRFAEQITEDDWQALWKEAVKFCGQGQANTMCRKGEKRAKRPRGKAPVWPIVALAPLDGEPLTPRRPPLRDGPDSFALGDTPRPKEEAYLWVLAVDSVIDGLDVAAGTEVDVLSSDPLGAKFGVHIHGGSEYIVERVAKASLSLWCPLTRGTQARHTAALPGVPPLAALRAELGRGADAQAAAGASLPKGKEKEEEVQPDVRVLEVDYDTHGTRTKVWSEVCAESSEHRFRDWPVTGPLTVLHLIKHILRYGPLPTQWIEAWARRKHIATTDRVFHELRSLAEIIETLGVYDQLNLPALAGIEILCRCFQTLLEAHSTPGAKPNYGMAEVYAGVSLLEDGVCPELRTFGARRLREKQLENSVQRVSGVAPHLAADDGGAEIARDEPEIGRAVGRGAGRRGRPRGLNAPAAIQS